MLNQENLKSVIDAYEESNATAIREARDLKIPVPTHIKFRTSALDGSTIGTLINQIPALPRGEANSRKRGFLYLFRLDDSCTVPSPSIADALRASKACAKDGDDEKLPAINEDHDGRVLYVGRSWKARTRIKEHLRSDCSKKTYALRLGGWAGKLNLEVELLVWELVGISSPALQVVEDGLWDSLRPVFGRRGTK